MLHALDYVWPWHQRSHDMLNFRNYTYMQLITFERKHNLISIATNTSLEHQQSGTSPSLWSLKMLVITVPFAWFSSIKVCPSNNTISSKQRFGIVSQHHTSHLLDITGAFTCLLVQPCIDGMFDTPSTHSTFNLTVATDIALHIHSILQATLLSVWGQEIIVFPIFLGCSF